MRINKYSVIWTDDNGEGHVINYVDGAYRLYNIAKNYMIDFFGDIDIDVLLKQKDLYDENLTDFKRFVQEDFIKMFVEDMIKPEQTKIYKNSKNEYLCYKNNKKITLYSPAEMKQRAEENFKVHIDNICEAHIKKYHIVQGG
jgi:hypothetical protein